MSSWPDRSVNIKRTVTPIKESKASDGDLEAPKAEELHALQND